VAREVRDERSAQLLNTLRCETRNHVFGIEQTLTTLGQVPRRIKGRRLQGLVEAYNALLRSKPSQIVLDTYDLIVVLKALRVTVTGYRVLITLALRLNHPQIVDVLRQHLWEDEAAAERLHQQLARAEPEQSSYQFPPPAERPVSRAEPPSHGYRAESAASEGEDLPPDSPEDRENVLAGGQETY